MRVLFLTLILLTFTGCGYWNKVTNTFTDFDKKNQETIESLEERVDEFNELVKRSSEVLESSDRDEIVLYVQEVWDEQKILVEAFESRMKDAKNNQEKEQWTKLKRELVHVAEKLDDINLGEILERCEQISE